MKTESYRKILDALAKHQLAKHQVEYILIGGVAVILHGVARITEDLDIFVRVSEDNIQKN